MRTCARHCKTKALLFDADILAYQNVNAILSVADVEHCRTFKKRRGYKLEEVDLLE